MMMFKLGNGSVDVFEAQAAVVLGPVPGAQEAQTVQEVRTERVNDEVMVASVPAVTAVQAVQSVSDVQSVQPVQDHEDVAPGEAMVAALDRYRVRGEGELVDGLIVDIYEDQALVDALSAYLLASGLSVDEVENLNYCGGRFTEIWGRLVESLRGQIWVGREMRTLENGGSVPKTRYPVYSTAKRKAVFDAVKGRIWKDWVPATPTLEHVPDAGRFVELCSRIFPNVKRPHDVLNAIRSLVENVHAACGTPGAVHRQKAAWLYSHRTGGTGKGVFLSALSHALRRLGVDSAYAPLDDSQYVSPAIGMHTVSVCDDVPRLSASMAERLNNVIDQAYFSFNEKYGAKGSRKSVATLICASNWVPFEQNTRRWSLMEYQPVRLDVLSDATRRKYLPYWDDEEGRVEAIVELFRVAPFLSERADWTDLHQGRHIEAGTRYEEAVEAIEAGVEYCARRAKDAHPGWEGAPSDWDASHMRPTAFARIVAEATKGSAQNVRAMLLAFLAEMSSKCLLNGCGGGAKGTTPIERRFFDWVEIELRFGSAGLDVAGPNDEDDETAGLEELAQDWREYVQAEGRKEVL